VRGFVAALEGGERFVETVPADDDDEERHGEDEEMHPPGGGEKLGPR
jgi:hypothetical protein